MRILFIIHQFMPEFLSGTERFTLNIAKLHQHNGHRVHILTCSVSDGSLWADEVAGLRYVVIDGVPVYGLPRALLGHLAEIGADDGGATKPLISAFLDRGGYDVVHVTHSMRMLPAIDVVRERSIPYLITLTDYFSICYRTNLKRVDGDICSGPRQGTSCKIHCSNATMTEDVIRARWERFSSLLFSAAEVVGCSTFITGIFQQEFPDLPIRTLNHGIDLLRFPRVTTDRKTAPLVFGFIGTLSEAKGVHVLAEAFARAHCGDARLELVGPAYNNHEFLDRVTALGGPRISIRSAVEHSEIPEVLASFDVLCIPSLWPEPGSLALREGFAAGLPALVSDTGWPAQVVRESLCGKTVPVGDVAAWQHAIEEIGGNRTLLQQWGKNVPMQLRVEEESFFYDQLYRRAHLCRRN